MTQLRFDLVRASGVELARINVTDVVPSGEVVHTYVPINRPAAASNTVTQSYHVSRASGASANTTLVITSSHVTATVEVLPSVNPAAISPEAFKSNLTTAFTTNTTLYYTGALTQFIESGNFTNYMVLLCQDNVYRTTCGTTATPDSGSSDGLFGLPLGAAIGIIVGGVVFVLLIILIIYCLWKTRTVKKDFDRKTPEEKEAIYRRALERKKAAEAEAKAAKKGDKLKSNTKAGKDSHSKSSGDDSSGFDSVHPRTGSGSNSPVEGPSRRGGQMSHRHKEQGIELPAIEPQWDSAMYVPQHLKKMAAVVTARTAGNEAPDAYEQQPVLKDATASDANVLHGHDDVPERRRRPQQHQSQHQHDPLLDAENTITADRPPPAAARRAMAPATGSGILQADSRGKRPSPIVVSGAAGVNATSPQAGTVGPTQRAAQMDRQRMLDLQQQQLQMAQQHYALQAARMNSPSAYHGARPVAQPFYGIPVAGGVAPQRLPSGGGQRSMHHPQHPMYGNNTRMMAASGPSGSPTRRPYAGRLTAQQLAQQVQNMGGHRF